MTRFIKRTAVICIFAFLAGCASVPEFEQDCEIARYKQQWETVDECKLAVLKHEDRRALRAGIEDKRKACVVPRWWDSKWKVCRTPQAWLP